VSEAEALPSGATFSFGRFHSIATRRLLLENDQPVRVGSRALEILLALVEACRRDRLA
jgi:DNA-binding winged helix-turn-helix (wHTH) protein